MLFPSSSLYSPNIFLNLKEQTNDSSRKCLVPFCKSNLFPNWEKYSSIPIYVVLCSSTKSERKSPINWYRNVRAQSEDWSGRNTEELSDYWTPNKYQFVPFRKIANFKLAKPGVQFGSILLFFRCSLRSRKWFLQAHQPSPRGPCPRGNLSEKPRHPSTIPGWETAQHPDRQSRTMLARRPFAQMKSNACKPYDHYFVFPEHPARLSTKIPLKEGNWCYLFVCLFVYLSVCLSVASWTTVS